MQQLELDQRKFKLELFKLSETAQKHSDNSERRITIFFGLLVFLKVAAAVVSIAIALGWIA